MKTPQKVDDRTVPAGAAEFFAAFLGQKGHTVSRRKHNPPRGYASKTLFVSGSTSSYGRAFRRRCEAQGIPVLCMPLALFETRQRMPGMVRQWAEATVRALERHPQAMVAIDQPLCLEPGLPQILCEHLGDLVKEVLEGTTLEHLYVEGGETASVLIRRMEWTRLRVRAELAPGVVCVQVPGRLCPLLTMKPGSYKWPGDRT